MNAPELETASTGQGEPQILPEAQPQTALWPSVQAKSGILGIESSMFGMRSGA